MKAMAGIALIIIGVIFLIAGTAITLKKSKSQVESLANTIKDWQKVDLGEMNTSNQKNTVTESGIIENKQQDHLNTREQSSLSSSSQSNLEESNSDHLSDSQKKGEEFEKFIVKKFNKEYFTLKEWTSDKYIDGIYAESTRNPDIVGFPFLELVKSINFV